jgi:hypothetical protein
LFLGLACSPDVLRNEVEAKRQNGDVRPHR